MILTGHVVSGLGRAAANVDVASADLARVLGGVPFPGTLNVRLAAPFEPPPGAVPAVLPILGQRAIPFYLYSARLGGVPVWVTRSLSQIENTDDLLEIVAMVGLREHLNLKDGDLVRLELL